MMNDEKKEKDFEQKKEQKIDTKRTLQSKLSYATQLFVPILAIVVVLGMFSELRPNFFRRTPKKSVQDRFFEYLAKGLSRGQFSEDFVKTGFNHFDREADGVLSKYGYVETLEDFVVFLNSRSEGEGEALSGSLMESANQLLGKAKETEPFASLPREERRLMEHIQILVKAEAKQDDLSYAMNELKQVLLARHKEYQRIERQNAWAIPLAFTGAILTIIFGAWSVVLGIRKRRMELGF